MGSNYSVWIYLCVGGIRMRPLTTIQAMNLIVKTATEAHLSLGEVPLNDIVEEVMRIDEILLDATLVPQNIRSTTVEAVINKAVNPYIPPANNDRYYAGIAEDEARRDSAWRSK